MAKEIIMNNAVEKFSKARENCVGMSEEVYAVIDYMSTVAHDSLYPQWMVMYLGMVMDDVQRGRCGFAFSLDKELPVYLRNHKNQVLSQIPYVLQVIDEIAEPEFAEEVRVICKKVMNWDPQKRVKAELDDNYPVYVKVAVDWWANEVASRKHEKGKDMADLPMKMLSGAGNSYTDEKMKLFKITLADEIISEMQIYGECTLYVDYFPCRVLEEAGNKVGISSMTGWPLNTMMTISKNLVEVSAGDNAPDETLWTE